VSDRRLVVLKFQADPIPDTLRERQIIDVSAEQLLEHFLKPLYRGLELTKLDAPLNPRVADFDLKRDALQIEEALLGLSDLRPDRYGESLIVETNGLDVTKDGGLAAALVKAPNGCGQILNWNRRSFRWDEFRARDLPAAARTCRFLLRRDPGEMEVLAKRFLQVVQERSAEGPAQGRENWSRPGVSAVTRINEPRGASS
jgi:hypothetical protein